MPDAPPGAELAELMVRLGRDTASRRRRWSRPWTSRWATRSATRWRWTRRWPRCAATARPTSRELCAARRRRSWSATAPARAPALDSGAAHERYQRWVAAQGGDPDAPLPRAPVVVEVPAPARRRRAALPRLPGRRAGDGAGRRPRASRAHVVDHAVGVVVHRKRGDRVEAGEPLATVHARREADWMRWPRASRSATRRPSAGSLLLGESMPELPEVETVRRGLVKVLAGRELVGVEIRDGRLTAPADPTAVAHELLGAVVERRRPPRQVPADRPRRRPHAGQPSAHDRLVPPRRRS